MYIYNRDHKRNWLGFTIAAWWLGIFIVGVIVPITDHTLMAALKRVPLEIDLIRSIRYAIPLLLLATFYLIDDLQSIVEAKISKSGRKGLPGGILVLGLALTFGWMLRNNLFKNPAFLQTASCWSSGRLACPLPNDEKLIQRLELLDAVKSQTPEGATILATDISDLAFRYYALRSLVYNYKDGSALIYANHDDLLGWYGQFMEISAIERLKSNRSEFLDGLTDFARKYHANYIVLSEAYLPKEYLPVSLINIYSNPSYALYRVEN